MKIALIGATGNVGTKIVNEALSRGHEITAIVRSPEKVPAKAGLTAVKGDANESSSLAHLIEGHDVVASAVPFVNADPKALITAIRRAGVERLAVVGGAGSLKLPDGTRVIDSAGFPEAYKPEASRGADFLKTLKKEPSLDWTYLSPSAEIAPGDRTGKFRLGIDDLLIDEGGKSHISQEDYAVAFVDELESPKHSRRRFTVGY